MRRLTPLTAIAVLAFPASALAASGSGTVLSVDGKHHTIEVVNAAHVVHAYHVRGRLPKLHAGTRIRFKQSGGAISQITTVTGASSSVSFYGRVVRSNRSGLVLRLADGKTVSFASSQVRHSRTTSSNRHKAHHKARARAAGATTSAGAVTINIQGLQPGVVVLITESVDAQGNVTITISLPPSSSPVTTDQQASGVISDVGTDAFVLQTADGSDLRLHMAQAALANLNLNVCDTASVTYHQDAGMLIADSVNDTGASTSGDCAGGGDQSASQDDVGTITQVSGDGITIATQDQGTMTFSLSDPSITDGYQVGDVVDVTYVDNGDGTYTASDVEYVEQDASGTVTAVSDGSMTITNDNTGQPQTFVADPSQGLLDGVAVGDWIDVNYHQSSSQLVADSVDDPSSN